MENLTFNDVFHADLKPLGEAAGAWEDMAGKLSELAEEATRGMRKNARGATWAGNNSDVVRPFVDAVAAEFGDAASHAKDVASTLAKAHRALLAIQDELKSERERAKGKGIEIRDLGNGTVQCIHAEGSGHKTGEAPPGEDDLKELQEFADSVARLLTRATNRDHYTAGRLSRIHGNDKHNFAKNGSIDAYETKIALDHARKGPEMDASELKELNTLLKYNANNPEFTQPFFKGLGGPKETLNFYARMSIDGTDGATKTRLQGVQELQRHLGPALANATDPDHKGYLNWGAEFRKLGTREFDVGKDNFHPKGYQILGGILRHGEYDKRFLTPIAEHVVQLQHDNKYGYWPRSGDPDDNFGLNPNGKKDSGHDPVTSVMEALGHSPQAAEEFFSKGPVQNPAYVYDENGVRTKEPLDYKYLEELTSKDFPWADDGGMPEPGTGSKPDLTGKDALGHALEAATIGTPYDRPSGGDLPPHTPERAEIMRDVIRATAENPEFASADISDSLGRMAGEYAPEITRALAGQGDNDADGSDLDDLFKRDHSVDFQDLETAQFLDSVTRNPEGNAEVVLGTENYQAKLTSDIVDNPDDYKGSAAKNLTQATTGIGTVEGVAGSARSQEIIDGHRLSDADFNTAVEKRGELVKNAITLGLEPVAERAPIAGPLIEGTSDTVIGAVVESHQKNSSEEASDEAGKTFFDARSNSASWASQSVQQAGIPEGVHDRTDFLRGIENASNEGYQRGETLHRKARDSYETPSG